MTDSPAPPDSSDGPLARLARANIIRPLHALLAASVLVPLALFIFASLESRHRLFSDAQEAVGANAAILREHALKVFESQDLAIQEIDARLANRSRAAIAGSSDLHRVLVNMARRFEQVHAIAVIGRRGNVLLSSRTHPPPDVNMSDSTFFEVLRDRNVGTYVSAPYDDPLTGDRVYSVSRRISSTDGSFSGVILVTVDPMYFARHYASFVSAAGQTAMLVRSDGVTLVRVPPAEGNVTTLAPGSPLRQAVERASGGVYVGRSTLDGEERMVGYQKVGAYPVFVGYGVTTDEILRRWYGRVGTYGMLASLFAMALALTTLSALRRTRDVLALQVMLRRSNEALERRVGERTAELSTANASLQGANDALKAAVAERELLLREIHHRVKNNLQVIISLLNLQAHAAGPPLIEAFNESLRRIRTMARIHELIYSSDDVTNLDFSKYLDQLSHELVTFYGIADRVSCVLRTEPLRLDLDTATPLAMIVNEVLSNACKHAFPGGRKGTIAIELARRDRRVDLRIADDGVGVAPGFEDTQHKSMGMRLVRTLSSRMGGDFDFTPGPNGVGTVFRLSFEWPGDETGVHGK